MSDILHERGKALEDIFFAERDRQLLAALKAAADREAAAAQLGALTGVTDAALLARAAGLGLSPATFAAFSIVPLLFVAWGDELLDTAEREAILVEASAMGILPGSPAAALLDGWLQRSSNAELIEAWKAFQTALSGTLSAADRASISAITLARAERVARASGGVLGIGAVSGGERAALAELRGLLG
jgi:hypothetical protein